MAGDPVLETDLHAAIAAGLASHEHLLACFDFDGTLAPIVDDPARARALQATEGHLEALSGSDRVSTAVVSGRALNDVVGRIDGLDVYAGNHGLELKRNGSVTVHPIADRRASRIDRCCDRLTDRLEQVDGCRLENKRLTATVHYRQVPTHALPTVRKAVHEVAETVGNGTLQVTRGKAILEIGPRVHWSKGHAVSLLRDRHAGDPFVLFVGDDVTDESAFRRIEPDGLAIAVDRGADTDASHVLSSPRAVEELLAWLRRHLEATAFVDSDLSHA